LISQNPASGIRKGDHHEDCFNRTRRLVSGLVLEKDAYPLMHEAGYRLITPTYTGLGEREHLANPSNDLETHIQDLLNVIKYEGLREIVLVGHSYGGMVATGVADRMRDLIEQLIYLDAFVPQDGQALFALIPLDSSHRMLESVSAGDGWRAPPNPSPP
jgi:pimeloyl-ACP methyl ester carboxylesterase